MSRRTAEASKAIREAWENEQIRVAEGKGTRDWTPEQQQSILDLGKAYDEDGKAFIGHHMKSAEAYPEYQGDPENIQFLSYQEHLKAHDGNWRTPSNWYYDPVTGIKHEFGDGKYVPCEIIELSSPLSPPPPIEPEVTPAKETETEQNPKDGPVSAESAEEQFADEKDDDTPPPYTPPVRYQPEKKGFWDKAGDAIGSAFDWVKDFVEEHPIISGLIGAGLAAVGKAAVDSATSKHSSERHYPSYDPSSYRSDPSDDSYDDSDDSDFDDDSFNNDSTSTRDYPDERSSPTEHDVSGYTRQQNGKTVNVRPYKRGGK